MTKKELKEIVYEACELLETEREGFACNALIYKDLYDAKEYCQFYWKKDEVAMMYGDLLVPENLSARIISLLWFLEVYGEWDSRKINEKAALARELKGEAA